jgi:hypothetical protein
LENTSETNEEGDVYALGLKKETNQDGLKIFVGGQPLSDQILFRHFPFGGYKTIVEVFRGPNVYDYSATPIELYWGSGCQDDLIMSTIMLRPMFLKTCAKVEFHHDLQTFAISPSSKYVCLKFPSFYLF